MYQTAPLDTDNRRSTIDPAVAQRAISSINHEALASAKRILAATSLRNANADGVCDSEREHHNEIARIAGANITVSMPPHRA